MREGLRPLQHGLGPWWRSRSGAGLQGARPREVHAFGPIGRRGSRRGLAVRGHQPRRTGGAPLGRLHMTYIT